MAAWAIVEETGAAQHYRDARIAPIYEGTNGIQAADLVGRKLGLEGGDVAAAAARRHARRGRRGGLLDLTDVARAGRGTAVRRRGADDRLAASYPFLTMLSTLVCGWLMKRQLDVVESGGIAESRHFLSLKRSACLYYLRHVVPEAAGLAAQAIEGSALFYPDEELFP